MTTKLEKKTLRREVTIGGEPWVVTIAPDHLKLTQKGRRKGIELAWKDIVSGEAALAAALNASLRPEHRRARKEVETPAGPGKRSSLRVVR
jgi:hypothetical protein